MKVSTAATQFFLVQVRFFGDGRATRSRAEVAVILRERSDRRISRVTVSSSRVGSFGLRPQDDSGCCSTLEPVARGPARWARGLARAGGRPGSARSGGGRSERGGWHAWPERRLGAAEGVARLAGGPGERARGSARSGWRAGRPRQGSGSFVPGVWPAAPDGRAAAAGAPARCSQGSAERACGAGRPRQGHDESPNGPSFEEERNPGRKEHRPWRKEREPAHRAGTPLRGAAANTGP